MATANLDITIIQGVTFKLDLTLRDGLDALIDLTAYSLKGHAKQAYNSKERAIEFVFVKADQTTNPGAVSMTFPYFSSSSMDLSRLPFSDGLYRLIYDVELTDGAGEPARLLSGNVFISPEVTK